MDDFTGAFTHNESFFVSSGRMGLIKLPLDDSIWKNDDIIEVNGSCIGVRTSCEEISVQASAENPNPYRETVAEKVPGEKCDSANAASGEVRSFIESKPWSYLDEMQYELFDQSDIRVSLPTISNTLHAMRISRKSLRREASERSQLCRDTYFLAVSQFTHNQLIFLDESAANGHTMWRKYLSGICSWLNCPPKVLLEPPRSDTLWTFYPRDSLPWSCPRSTYKINKCYRRRL